jgi:hypothetical protein
MSETQSGGEPERSLSSKQVKEILERAVAIDISASDSFSLEHLRAVADEAGISQAALTAALREVRDAGDAGLELNATSVVRGETGHEPLRARIRSLLSGRVSMLAAGAIGVSVLIVFMFMWLVPNILQHIGH